MRDENRAAHDAAMTRCDQAIVRVREIGRREVELDAALQAHGRASQLLQDLRARAVRLQPAAELGGAAKAEERGVLQSRLEQVRSEVEDTVAEEARLGRSVLEIARAREEASQAAVEARTAVVHVELARAALLVLGRSGAQRRVAEGALGQIEQIANDGLEACGEDLRVSVAWAREGHGLATACDACGAPYPSSAKIKACPRCGGERGPKLVHRLDLELSDRSGGLEDLAGCVLALAAGTWLARARGAAWGTALLDEPLASLDAARRKALVRGLPSLLAASGIEQAILVAHTPAAMDALPARIQVTRRGAWSEVRVE
jgi:DNA repair exonuclease SbcCD ATPase subunit